MEQLITVINYVARAAAVFYTLSFGIVLTLALNYSEFDRIRDARQGFRRVFTPGRPLFRAVIAWAIAFGTL